MNLRQQQNDGEFFPWKESIAYKAQRQFTPHVEILHGRHSWCWLVRRHSVQAMHENRILWHFDLWKTTEPRLSVHHHLRQVWSQAALNWMASWAHKKCWLKDIEHFREAQAADPCQRDGHGTPVPLTGNLLAPGGTGSGDGGGHHVLRLLRRLSGALKRLKPNSHSTRNSYWRQAPLELIAHTLKFYCVF